MSRFDVLTTPLPGLLVVQRLCNEDERGYFSRFFCSEELAAHGFNEPIAQINQTLTLRRGAARGLHFQRPPHAEDKFVSCLRGKVWDVAVDLRRRRRHILRRWRSCDIRHTAGCGHWPLG